MNDSDPRLPRILVLSHLYPRPDAPALGSFVDQSVQALRKLGCPMEVLVPVPKVPWCLRPLRRYRHYLTIPQAADFQGVPVRYCRALFPPGRIGHGLSGYTLPRDLRRPLLERLAAFQPDILHAHSATPDGFAAMLLLRRMSLPWVCSLRGDDINLYPSYRPFTREQTRRVLASARRLVSVSAALGRAAEQIAKPRHPVKVIHNGCDLKRFSPDPERRRQQRGRLGLSDGDRMVLFAGVLERRKGIFELLDAFPTIGSTMPRPHLVIAGAMADPGVVKRLDGLDAGSRARVHVLGLVLPSSMPDLYNAADIFVLPSHSEGFPNVVKEALACGVPVVASDVGGVREVVEEGRNGLLHAPQDPIQLREALNRLLDHPDLARAMGTAGRCDVAERFSWEHHAREHLALYQDLLADDPAPGRPPCAA